MEESSAKGEDAGNDDKSPPKKARFDEQPSTSSCSTSVPVANGASGKSDTTAVGKNDAKNNKTNDTASTTDESVAAAASIQRWKLVASGANWDDWGEDELCGELASSSTNGTNEPIENLPAAASSNANRPQRTRDGLERLQQNASNRVHEYDHDYDESSVDEIDLDDDEETNRVREEVANDLAVLLAPSLNRYDGLDDSDNSSREGQGQDVNGDAAWDANIEQAEALMRFEDSTSHSFSRSDSSSEASFPSSSESETSPDDDPTEPKVLDIRNLECLRTETLKGTWDIMREMMQRQHGLPFSASAANVGSGRFNPSQFQKRAYGSVHMMKRLALMHHLEEHTGCVNSLSFNSSGKLLASGSDDLYVNLWHWESKKLLKSIASGHRSNVFQTKFMEYKGYEGELEIISTGRDGHVRHTRVDPSGHSTTELLFRGHAPIHKIAIPARNEFSFLTAGEDGKVRIYDLRQGKQEILKKVHRPLFSIATHPYDSEFCIAGSDSSVRVYDMRNTQKVLKLLFSQRNSKRKASESVTCAVYNDTGTEILASYSDDDIYLYDNTAQQALLKPISRYQGHCNTQTIKGVNFFGPRSEYVVSGSDCGYIFIWDKRSRVIVNWLNGDRRGAVNVVEPHPEFPILATSGVDDDVKIWAPRGPNDQQTVPVFAPQDLRRIVRRNILDRRQSSYLPRSALSAYFNTATFNSFRDRLVAGEIRSPTNHPSDSDTDPNDDEDFLGV